VSAVDFDQSTCRKTKRKRRRKRRKLLHWTSWVLALEAHAAVPACGTVRRKLAVLHVDLGNGDVDSWDPPSPPLVAH